MSLIDVFTKYGLKTTQDLKDNTDKTGINASNKTKESIGFEVFTEGPDTIFQVFANKALKIRETGRGPTQSGQAGNPTLRETIRQWIDDKGIVPEGDISKDSLAYLIARKIHREGYKGEPGLITDIINEDLISNIEKEIADQHFLNLLETIEINLTK